MTTSRVVGLGLVIALLVGGCGGGGGEEVLPSRVVDELAPAEIGDGLKLFENLDKSTVAAFANLGDNTLLSDGRIWEIRRVDRLIGTLQINTVLPKVDLTDEKQRTGIAAQIIPGELTRLRVAGIEVYALETEQKAIYAWFGQDMFQVMQVKDTRLEGVYEPLLADIIDYQSTVDAWKPLTDSHN